MRKGICALKPFVPFRPRPAISHVTSSQGEQHPMNTKRAVPVIAAIVCLLIAAVGAQQTAPTNQAQEPPILTVSGQGKVMAKPDRAILQLGAVAQAPEASAAQEQVNQIMQQALEAIKALGIAEENITTVGLNLYPVYEEERPEPRRTQEPRIAGYRAGNTIRIQIDNLEQVGDVIDAGVNAGANQIEGLSFELKDDLPQRLEALRLAVQEAREKAQTMASAADMKLGGVRDMQEGGVNVFRPERRFAARQAMAMEMDMGSPVQPGQVQVEANVTVSYDLAR